jgi:superoxide reductase
MEETIMCENKFYICEHCGNIIGMIHDSGVSIVCCGENMKKLEPGTVDASREKHVPVVTTRDNFVKVSVGSVAHPMIVEHSILWIYLQTDKGGHRKCLNPGELPEVTFALENEKPVAAYAYCNLHGLWKMDI